MFVEAGDLSLDGLRLWKEQMFLLRFEGDYCLVSSCSGCVFSGLLKPSVDLKEEHHILQGHLFNSKSYNLSANFIPKIFIQRKIFGQIFGQCELAELSQKIYHCIYDMKMKIKLSRKTKDIEGGKWDRKGKGEGQNMFNIHYGLV